MEMKDLCNTQASKQETTEPSAKTIAHDFNNILTAIMGYCEILKMDLETDGRSLHYLDLILEAAKKAADLSKQIGALGESQTTNHEKTNPARTD